MGTKILYTDLIYNPREIKREDYLPLHLKCFLIRTLTGVCIARFIIREHCIELVMDSASGTEHKTESHTQVYGKNILNENDFVMDVAKVLRYKDVDGKKEIVSNSFRVVPITEKQYNMLYNFIELHGLKIMSLTQEFNDRLNDLKEHLNID